MKSRVGPPTSVQLAVRRLEKACAGPPRRSCAGALAVDVEVEAGAREHEDAAVDAGEVGECAIGVDLGDADPPVELARAVRRTASSVVQPRSFFQRTRRCAREDEDDGGVRVRRVHAARGYHARPQGRRASPWRRRHAEAAACAVAAAAPEFDRASFNRGSGAFYAEEHDSLALARPRRPRRLSRRTMPPQSPAGRLARAAAPAPLPGRTITVSGAAEILTAPDTFELTIGFDVQAPSLEYARDDSRKRAAALLAVVARHKIPDSDVQTQELSLQPRYDNLRAPQDRRLPGDAGADADRPRHRRGRGCPLRHAGRGCQPRRPGAVPLTARGAREASRGARAGDRGGARQGEGDGVGAPDRRSGRRSASRRWRSIRGDR